MTTITAEERTLLRKFATSGVPFSVPNDAALRLLDALDAAEQRAAPLVWRALTGEAIEALPPDGWCWLRGGGAKSAVPVAFARGMAFDRVDTGPHERQIAGPIPEPVEGERT